MTERADALESARLMLRNIEHAAESTKSTDENILSSWAHSSKVLRELIALVEMPQTVFVLHQETSDQMGTSKIVGVYSSPEKCARDEYNIWRYRTFVQRVELDAKPEWVP
jgi:hypothetical protein